jgi:predicted dehydrogenase
MIMLKVGVLGEGHLVKYHLNNWKEIPEVSLVGFFDPNNDNAKEVEKTYGLKRYMDEEALIAACDVTTYQPHLQNAQNICHY